MNYQDMNTMQIMEVMLEKELIDDVNGPMYDFMKDLLADAVQHAADQYQEGHSDGYVEGERDGYTDGENVGYENGRDEGRDEGYDEGRDEGYDEGYDDGFDAGRA